MVGVPVIVKVTGFDVAPHVPELTTVIEIVLGLAMLAFGTVAVSCVEETNFVVRDVPFHCTVDEPETKFVPITVKVKQAPPAVAQLGLIEVIVGTVLTVITKVALPVLHEVTPLLALIVTLVVPAVVGVPEITPVLVLIVRPAGSGVALKLVGLLVAVIE